MQPAFKGVQDVLLWKVKNIALISGDIGLNFEKTCIHTLGDINFLKSFSYDEPYGRKLIFKRINLNPLSLIKSFETL
jgi:hypothetical protein